MTNTVGVWDSTLNEFVVRPATSEELAQAERDHQYASAERAKQFNASIKAQLEANDLRAIRAMLEGDQDRLSVIRFEQEQLRLQLVPE